MIEIRPNALYTRKDLSELLRPIGIDPDSFVARIRPAKRFRKAWWGADLIQAIDLAPILGEEQVEYRSRRKDRQERSRGNGVDSVLDPLHKLRDESRKLNS